MKRQLLSTMMTFSILASIFLVAIPISASELVLPDYEPVDWQSGLAGEVLMPEIEPIEDFELSNIVDVESFHSTPPVGTWVWDWYLSARADAVGYGSAYMQLRAVVGNAEVWVAEDASLMYPTGDPRNADPKNWYVTDEMAQYIAEEFDNIIYPTDVSYFGAPFDRDGTGTVFEGLGWPSWTYDWIETFPYNPQRVIIKIFNIVDEGFFDPTYPYYVVGFYNSLYTQVYYNRNMIHIDNWKYCERLGPEGYKWYPKTKVVRPYVYESTVAHEFQHNIHGDWQPAAETWMNEGCSMYAELVCGYGIDYQYFNSYFATPDNSLTIWGDQGDINILADYGVSALWTAYLSDHYGGGSIITQYVQSGIPGIAGINAALAALSYTETFDDVYRDWRIANLVRSDSPGDEYNYQSIDLNAPEIIPVRTYDLMGPIIPATKGLDFGMTYSVLDYPTYVYEVGSYGSDYIKLTKLSEDDSYLLFDGDDNGGRKWIRLDLDEDEDLEWYSTVAGGLADISIIAEETLPTAPVTLTIRTYYDIEDYWDYGFVQISTDDGATWTSLENDYTTFDHDPDAMAEIVANLPGLTGWSGDWVTMDFDLSAYAGETVLIRFRYMTDPYVNYPGWWIEDITINGGTIEDDFEIFPGLGETDFVVTVIGVEFEKGHRPEYKPIADLTLNDLTEESTMTEMQAFIETKGYVLLVISPTVGPADYAFSITSE